MYAKALVNAYANGFVVCGLIIAASRAESRANSLDTLGNDKCSFRDKRLITLSANHNINITIIIMESSDEE